MNMNSNFELVLKRLSKVVAATERPAKKRWVAKRTKQDVQPSEAEDDIYDSEQLLPQIASGENGNAPDKNSSQAEDDLLREIAKIFLFAPNVRQLLVDWAKC